MLEDLDDNYRACGFCSKPTHDTIRFNDAQLDFLEIYLDVKGVSLPTRVCRACLDEVKKAKAFRDTILRSFDTLKTFGVSSQLIWGRAKEDRTYLKRKFEGDQSDDFAPALDYVRGLFQLQMPEITISKDEKTLANSYVTLSSSGRVIKKKPTYDEDFWGGDDNHWDGDDNWNSVKEEPKVPQKTEDEWEAELSDCGEQFPAKGPYQCEICQDITKMKKMFVAHIKDNHASMIDNKVLKGLESDLQKRQKKICEKMGKKYVPPRKTPLKPRKPRAKKKKEYSDDSNTEDENDDAEFQPTKKKKKASKKSSGVDGSEASTPAKPKASMKKRYEDDEKFDPGDLDDDFSGGEDGAVGGDVDDAIQQAVKASLETAAKELNDTPTMSPDAYHDPAPQPDVQVPVMETNCLMPQWDGGQCAMETVVETTLPVTSAPGIARPWGADQCLAMQEENSVAAASIAQVNNPAFLFSNIQYFQPQ